MLNKYDKFHRNSEMASLSNYGLQNHKERPKGSTNNRDMVDKAKCGVVSEGGNEFVTYI